MGKENINENNKEMELYTAITTSNYELVQYILKIFIININEKITSFNERDTCVRIAIKTINFLKKHINRENSKYLKELIKNVEKIIKLLILYGANVNESDIKIADNKTRKSINRMIEDRPKIYKQLNISEKSWLVGRDISNIIYKYIEDDSKLKGFILGQDCDRHDDCDSKCCNQKICVLVDECPHYNLEDECKDNSECNKGGKKIRRHKGINQKGGNKGKLKKGYRYTGERTKTGLAKIKRVI